MRWSSSLRKFGRVLALAPSADRSASIPVLGEIAAECEAYLSGELVEHRIAQHQDVLPWEWTNLLAHGSREALCKRSASDPSRSPSSGIGINDVWQAARSYMASRVLDLVDDRRTLAELQRTVLVPLEHRLASSDEAIWWQPNEWVMEIEAALTRDRRSPRSPARRGSHAERSGL